MKRTINAINGIEFSPTKVQRSDSTNIDSFPLMDVSDEPTSYPVQLSDLPVELKDMITQYLSYGDLKSLGKTNMEWSAITRRPKDVTKKQDCFYSSYLFPMLKIEMSSPYMRQILLNRILDQYNYSEVKGRKVYYKKHNDGTEELFNDHVNIKIFDKFILDSFYQSTIEDDFQQPSGTFRYENGIFNSLAQWKEDYSKKSSKIARRVAVQTDCRCFWNERYPNFYNPFLHNMYVVTNPTDEYPYEDAYNIITFVPNGTVYVTEKFINFFYNYATIDSKGPNTLISYEKDNDTITIDDNEMLNFMKSLVHILSSNFHIGRLYNGHIFVGIMNDAVKCVGAADNSLQNIVPIIQYYSASSPNTQWRIDEFANEMLYVLYGVSEDNYVGYDILQHANYPKTILYLYVIIAIYQFSIDIPTEFELMTLNDADVSAVSSRLMQQLMENDIDVLTGLNLYPIARNVFY